MMFRRQAIAAAVLVTYLAVDIATQEAARSASGGSDVTSIPFKKCWEYSLPDSNGGTLVSSNGTVYFAEAGGRIRALSSKTGQVSWVTELGGNITATLVVPKFGIAVISTKLGSTNSDLRLLNFETGLVKYAVPLSTSGDIYLLTSGEKTAIAEKNGHVAVVDAASGSRVWTANLGGPLTAVPAISKEVLVAATTKNKVDVLDMENGRLLGAIEVKEQVTALTMRDNGMIVAGDERGGVTTYRNSAGDVWWRFKSGARIGTVVGTPDGVLVGSFDNFVYYLSNYSGDVKWKRRLNGRIVSEPLVVENVAFVASSTEEFAVGIDLTNGRPTDQLPFGENQYLTTKPVFTNRDTVVFGLTGALAGFSQGQCSQK